jgi:sortase A
VSLALALFGLLLCSAAVANRADDRGGLPVAAGPATTDAAALSPAPVLTDAGPATTSSTTTTVTLPETPTDRPTDGPLPVPEPLPEPYAPTANAPIGRITIPALGLDHELYEGMALTAINRGPSHWPGTARPGELGNVVVAGHRTTFGQPFRHLDRLQAGDRVIFSTAGGFDTYEVTSVEVVGNDAMYIADQTRAYTGTLFACHPPGSARQRIVAHLELL